MRGERKNNRYKFLIIIFTLVIPVIVYVFLKRFGENHFTVPVFYGDGVPPDTIDCRKSQIPHRVSLQTAQKEPTGEPASGYYDRKLSVIDIDMEIDNRPGNPGYPLNRVADIFAGNTEVQFILVRPGRMVGTIKQSSQDDRFIFIESSGERIMNFAKCELILLDFPENVDSMTRRLVLVDSHGRIRGYYQAGDFDEIDRMILEMKIILTEEY